MNKTQMAPLILPPVGLGGWPFGAGYDWGPLDEPQAQKAVLAALEAGICFVDTAPVYGDGASEQFLGRVLSSYRHQVLLADKCGLVKNGSWTDHDLRPATIRRQLEESLSRLKTDYLDLYQIHYPDPHVPLEEAVGELDNLRREGKIRAIGLCNVSAQQINRAVQTAPIFSVQNEYSLLHPGAGETVFGTCQKRGILFIGYGVLCGGILSGKYTREPNFRRADARNYFYKCYRGQAFEQAQVTVARVRQLAAEKNCTPATVAVGWALSNPLVACVLCGARTPIQIRQNSQGANFVLNPQEIAFLEGKNGI